MAARTPMIEQYFRIKSRYPDAILFYRMGDFYEMFFEDAQVASRELEITLTSRNKGDEDSVPLCGIPHHAADSYIAKLIKRGYRVAVCEQTEDPKQAKGLVDRDVVRVITPGTFIDSNYLEPKSNNYLMAVAPHESRFGVALLDLSTGDFKVCHADDIESVVTEAVRNDPREIIVPEDFRETPQFADFHRTLGRNLFKLLPRNHFDFATARRSLNGLAHRIHGADRDRLDSREVIMAIGAALQYVRENEPSTLEHLKEISPFRPRDHMIVDETTKRNLELTESLIEGKAQDSLLGLLDHSVTAMGARLLRQWLLYPLLDLGRIEQRLDAVAELREKKMERMDLREALKEVYDLARLNARIAMARANGRDLISLKRSTERLPVIRKLLMNFDAPFLNEIHATLDDLQDVREVIQRSIREDAPLALKEGGIIQEGYHRELDELRQGIVAGKSGIARLEREEKDRTGIHSLKVRFNQVFGYYIEVTKSHLDKIPEDYIRKQTLTNAERFITPKLKDYESRVLGAEEKISRLEYELFDEIRQEISKESQRIQRTASRLAQLDVLAAFASVADRHNYARPLLHGGTEIAILGGRHPVVEHLRSSEVFVPNDLRWDCDENQLLIITGPNMAGKSTFLRQVALIVLMAQIGSFVPAESASIGVVDRIFTRVGATDNLVRGQSTFMIEMMETARILRKASSRSLIILDEIGRGTSTFDGLSIAWAVAEHIHDAPNLGAKTLFATHYHELTELALTKPRVKNFSFAVREWNDEIIFLRKIVPGGTSRSYGIQVARLADLPQEVLERAKEILGNLEKGELTTGGVPRIALQKGRPISPGQLGLFSADDGWIKRELRELSIDTMSPIEALNKLHEMKKRMDEEG